MSDTANESSVKYWIPLESNPDVLNEFSEKLGITNVPAQYQFQDILGLDADLLAFVPQPVLAVVLLFPITEATEALRKEEQERMNAPDAVTPPSSLYYMKQTIGNACGTIALLHTAANSRNSLNISGDSFLDKFFSATETMSPEERGKYLEHPPSGAPSLDSIHENAAKQGQTAPPAADADVDLHFITFVVKEGRLWELDGRKSGPVDHGECKEESLLQNTATVVQKNFIEKAESLNFVLIGLAAAPEDD